MEIMILFLENFSEKLKLYVSWLLKFRFACRFNGVLRMFLFAVYLFSKLNLIFFVNRNKLSYGRCAKVNSTLLIFELQKLSIFVLEKFEL